MREIVAEAQPFVREEHTISRRPRALRRPALQARDHRGVSPSRSRELDDELAAEVGGDPGAVERVPERAGFRRPVPRSTCAFDGPARPLQADAGCRRLLARRRAPAAAPADLRDGVGIGQGSGGPPSTPRGGRAARPSPPRRRARPLLVPDEIGSGLAVFHPKGGLIRKVMEDYSRARHEQSGYSFVNSPHITKAELFETSGHLEWFAEGMFPPMELDDGQRYYLKPMNCPFHILIFRSRQRSYRELPLRLFEFGAVYRYEKSGVVHGLTRVRGMTQDDAHIFCSREQMATELHSLLTFVLDLLRDYGLDDFYLELSTRPEEKAVGIGRGMGGGDRGLAPRRARHGPRAGARRRRRRVLRAEDLRPGARRDRPDVADVDDPGRLPDSSAVRDRLRRR